MKNLKQFMISLAVIVIVSMITAYIIMDFYPEPIVGSTIAVLLGGSLGLYLYNSKLIK
jgi:hypothetical protein